MPTLYLPDLRLNAEITGPEGAPAVVMLHGLGLDLRIWDAVVDLMPRHRILRLDLRGHGDSDTPAAPYGMGALIRDTERAMDHFGLAETVVIGSGLGGLIAQGLAVKRLDLVRGVVLSNTAARIGFARQWQDQIEAVRTGGLDAILVPTLTRWLGRGWHTAPEMPDLRARLDAARPEGWMGAAAAIAGTDFYETTATLRLPALFIAGGNDGATPPDLVRETADLIPGSRYVMMRGAGHLPMVEKPAEYVAVLDDFLTAIGHG